ncbi:MAG: Hpt domain-containing protein [Desulfovibrio sp.]|jgi:two-component system chemotaxis sensor kinase CheA|nr:Hpt domain-containing protein [Desulfovibrio sp.]
MSQEFMDPEILADFIIESKEHLETIEPNLLELEKAPDNLSLLNEIFRPMHSLKGASGFLGLNKINGLAHKAESVMDELRKGAMTVTSEIMDVILATTDLLRRMIENLETENSEGDVDTSEAVAALEAILAGETPSLQTGGGAEEVAETALSPAAASADVGDGVAPADEASADAGEGVAPAGASADEAADAGDGVAQADAGGRPATDGEHDGETAAARKRIDTETWLESRDKLPVYPLTSFGEPHLRDFMEEAKENVSNLSDGLLDLEKHPGGEAELVNDIFRYFHNLKGNSGIIAYHEMNSLTHEAETLLNSLRNNEREVSGPLVDLLLLSVDVIEALVFCIDPVAGTATPFDISELLERLRAAVAGEGISLPDSIFASEPKAQVALASAETSAPAASQSPVDGEDVKIFKSTVGQQFSHITEAIKGMRADGGNRDYADAMFRSLATIQNCAGFMGLDEIKVYAARTAGIVDKGRSAGVDFSMMADLLEQECFILRDLISPAIDDLLGKMDATAGAATPESAQVQGAASGAKTARPEEKKPEAVKEPAAPGPAKAAALAASVAKPAVSGAPGGAKPAPPAAPATSAPQPAAPAPAAKPVVQPAAPAAKPAAPAPATPATKPAAPAPATSAAKPAAPAAKPGGGEASAKVSSTIRVDHEKLDHLMNLIGELIINRNRYSMLARQLEETGSSVDVSTIAQNLTETTYSMARISDDLQDTIMKVRMVPVASVFSRFPRLVRDLSRKNGKEVELIVEGEDTELDKSVVEVIGDPLVHLIRNSVDHGIEPEAVRAERGKPLQGSVWLRAFYKGNSVAIEIEDDGNGIDPEVMRQVGVRKGIITPEEAKNLDDREAIELIFAPGFSSAAVITDISGRGVGMDVVRTNIKNLKGSINTVSEVGKGTKFTLSLPLTLAIIDALMVNVDDEIFAIPLDAVSETVKIEAERLTDVKGRKAVTLRGDVLGIISLAEFLGLHSRMGEDSLLNVVVIHDNDRRLGLVVDHLLERQEVVIKPLGAYLGDIKGISGATIMGDGSVILILDPHEIYTLATSKAV